MNAFVRVSSPSVFCPHAAHRIYFIFLFATSYPEYTFTKELKCGDIERLPIIYRDVMHSFNYAELKYQEIAERQKIPLGTVKRRKHAAQTISDNGHNRKGRQSICQPSRNTKIGYSTFSKQSNSVINTSSPAITNDSQE